MKTKQKTNLPNEDKIDNNTELTLAEKPSHMRLLMLVLIILATMLSIGLLGLLEHTFLDHIINVLILGILFLSLFIYGLEHGRETNKIMLGKANDYRRIAFFCCVSSILLVIGHFLPSYAFPAMTIALVMSAGTNASIGNTYCIFMCLMLCMLKGFGLEEFMTYVFLSVAGCLMAEGFRLKKQQGYTAVIVIMTNLLGIQVFYYLQQGSFEIRNLLYGFCAGIFTVIIALVFHKKLYLDNDFEKKMVCLKIIQENYSLVKEIKKYSEIDYNHAVKVSQIAYLCAEHIGAESVIAMCAGFYYRVGKLEGEPFVENGVSLAQRYCFPEEIIHILYEYNGELRKPSSIESAIVHMVDTVVTKVELIGEGTLASSWNTDMLIYQTLNEKSGQGLYDDSGMSMNQFLRVREFLAKKEDLF